MDNGEVLVHNNGLPFSYLEPNQLATPPTSPARDYVADLCESGKVSKNAPLSQLHEPRQPPISPVSPSESHTECVQAKRPSLARQRLSMASFRRNDPEHNLSSTNLTSDVDVVRQPRQREPRCLNATMRHDKSKRLKIAIELLQSEQNYVDSLFMLRNTFITPLMSSSRSSTSILGPASMSAIFANFIDILHISAELLALLQERLDPSDHGVAASWNPEVDLVGDIFCTLGHFFKMYKTYCRNFTSASAVLEHEIVHNGGFNKFLAQSHISEALAGMSLQSHLLLPVQRIPRYRLLLSEMLKYTPPEHPDHAAISDACSIVSDAALGINEAIRQHESWQALLDLQMCFLNLDQPLTDTPSRVLLKKGSIIKICRKSHQKRELFLFNDCLIMATLTNSTSMFDAGQKHYSFSRRFALSTLSAEMPTQGTKIDCDRKFFWRLVSTTKSFLAYDTCPDERQSWVDSIMEAKINHLANSLQRTVLSDNPTIQIKGSRKRTQPGLAGLSSFAALFFMPDTTEYPILRNHVAPIWVEDSTALSCQRCHILFTFFRGRHHCRICGWLVCASCSGKRFMTSTRSEAFRSCIKCYADHFECDSTVGTSEHHKITSESSVRLDVPPLNMETFRRSTQRANALRARRRSLMLQTWQA